MASDIDIRALELLCSRLCHELISPVTAVANGAELLADDPGDEMTAEIGALLGKSAVEAARRLQFYRSAYGFGGSEEPMPLGQVRDLADDLLAHEKVATTWPDAAEMALPRQAAKILLNMIALAAECLPRGGEMRIGCAKDGGGVALEIACTGEGAKLRDDIGAGLAEGIDPTELTPRSVHAYFLMRLVGRAGGAFAVEAPGDGAVSFRASIAAA